MARQAGVSKATVSRDLNRSDALLSADIARHVAPAIADTAFQPSAMVRSLTHGRTRLHGQVQAVTLAQLLQQATIVALVLPLSHSTRGMFAAAAFARIKPDAIFINGASSTTAACAPPGWTCTPPNPCRWTQPCASIPRCWPCPTLVRLHMKPDSPWPIWRSTTCWTR
jgi:DeoR/GlpR family transcriptional regulator of sugar metabolism